MSNKYQSKREEVVKLVNNANSIQTLLHQVKAGLFAPSGIIGSLTEELKKASVEEKKAIGKEINDFRAFAEDQIAQRQKQLQKEEIRKQMEIAKVDGSFSITEEEIGSIHPISFVADEILGFFKRYGCQMHFGSEIETSWYNFDALNVTENHPARQMHDTFYLNSQHKKSNTPYLLRTHTTCVDIKTLSKASSLPLRSISFGKTFRKDSDRTHSPMFHQIEFLEVAEGVHLGHLKSVLTQFLCEFFEKSEVKLRLRPNYFPFTEPSFEVDICYRTNNGYIEIDANGDKYLEILGCGVLRPAVLQNCNVNSRQYVGIAAGLGVERIAMLKYGFKDVREFFDSNLHWLEQNSFDVNIF